MFFRRAFIIIATNFMHHCNLVGQFTRPDVLEVLPIDKAVLLHLMKSEAFGQPYGRDLEGTDTSTPTQGRSCGSTLSIASPNTVAFLNP